MNKSNSNITDSTLDDIFDGYLANPKLFKRRDVLIDAFIPANLPHRGDQIKQLGYILASSLRGAKPSNILCFGKTGTGKTAVSKYVLNKLKAKSKNLGFPLKFVYINCNQVDTNYRVFADLCKNLDIDVPFTGLATGEVFARFKQGLNNNSALFIIVLDEIDTLAKKSSRSSSDDERENNALYNLTRVNTDLISSRVSLIGISNDLKFKEYLDAQVLSSLSEEELVFRPYDAPELTDILVERSEIAFNDGALDSGVINLIAAIAAQEHGDARRAIDLLRVSGEIAEREGVNKITTAHVKKAQTAIERNTITEVVSTLPLHSKMVIMSIFTLESSSSEVISSGDVYESYINICKDVNLDCLTQRRVGDLINELDMLGIISARLESRGRYGRTKKIKFSVAKNLIENVLKKDELFSSAFN